MKMEEDLTLDEWLESALVNSEINDFSVDHKLISAESDQEEFNIKRSEDPFSYMHAIENFLSCPEGSCHISNRMYFMDSAKILIMNTEMRSNSTTEMVHQEGQDGRESALVLVSANADCFPHQQDAVSGTPDGDPTAVNAPVVPPASAVFWTVAEGEEKTPDRISEGFCSSQPKRELKGPPWVPKGTASAIKKEAYKNYQQAHRNASTADECIFCGVKRDYSLFVHSPA